MPDGHPDPPADTPRQIDDFDRPNHAAWQPYAVDDPHPFAQPCYFPDLPTDPAWADIHREEVRAAQHPGHPTPADVAGWEPIVRNPGDPGNPPCYFPDVASASTLRWDLLGPLYFPDLADPPLPWMYRPVPCWFPDLPRSACDAVLPSAFWSTTPLLDSPTDATQHDTPPQANVQPPQPTEPLPKGAIQPPQPEGPRDGLDGDGQHVELDRPPQPHGNPGGSYEGPERLGLMVLALRDGVTATAKSHGIPRRTLQGWLEDYGGLAEARAWLKAETIGAYLTFEQSLYSAAIRALEADTVPKDELWMTIRRLVEAHAVVPATAAHLPPTQPAGQAAAAAQATVTVKIVDETGRSEVIDVGSPPEESDG